MNPEVMNIDKWRDWLPDLVTIAKAASEKGAFDAVISERPHYREQYLDSLAEKTDISAVYLAVNRWLCDQTIQAFHATRLTKTDIEDISRNGLLPLQSQKRKDMLWKIVEEVCPPARRSAMEMKFRQSVKENEDRDRGAIFFCLSARKLKEEDSHYLHFGSEFGLVVLGETVGYLGKALFRQRTRAALVSYCFPGERVTSRLRIEEIDDALERGIPPDLERELLDFTLSVSAGQDGDKYSPAPSGVVIARDETLLSSAPHSISIVDEGDYRAPPPELAY